MHEPAEKIPPPSRLGRWLRLLRWMFISALAAVVIGNLWIVFRSSGRVHSDVQDIPANKVGLVLGTSSNLRGGHANPFFTGRMEAAAELYRAGKVRHLLLSGDNRKAGYDEPTAMRAALLERGVPENAMTLDYAGFRTLDSVVRAKEVFGVTQLTIITDDFHAERSVLLARHFGLDARAYCSKGVPLRWSKKTRLREIGARGKALLDLYVLRTAPHFLGRRISLPEH